MMPKDDTGGPPEDFHTEESRKIYVFFMSWAKLSLIPAVLVFMFYIYPWDIYNDPSSEMSKFGWPWASVFMMGATCILINIPNYIIAGVRRLALLYVTGR